MTDFRPPADFIARLDALLNAGKEDFDIFYAKHAEDTAEDGYVWVVLNHGNEWSVHTTLPTALMAAKNILAEIMDPDDPEDMTAQPHRDAPIIDMSMGDYWVQISREEVQT